VGGLYALQEQVPGKFFGHSEREVWRRQELRFRIFFVWGSLQDMLYGLNTSKREVVPVHG